MTTTTQNHHALGGGFRGHHVALLAVALAAGAVIGFGTSALLYFGVTPGPAVTSAVHVPVQGTSAAVLERELERAQRTLHHNQALLSRIETDPRWEHADQHEGLIYAFDTTLAKASATETRMEELRAQLAQVCH